MRPPVLHVAPALWSGAGAVITRLIESQRRFGPVAVVTSTRGGTARDWPEYRRRLADAGATHHAIDFLSRDADVFAAGIRALSRLVDSVRPAVVHAHAGVPSLGAALARAMSRERPRLIGQMYSWGPGRPDWMNVQDALGFGECDRVICSAYAYRDLLVRYGVPKHRITYLPWGLPLEQLPWRDLRWRGDRASNPIRLGFVGRIEPRKQQLALVEAFAAFRQRCPTAGPELELVGPIADHDYAEQIRRTIARARLHAVVRMTGRVDDVAAHVRHWDLFVSLSSDEGQGLAILEAMALGVPVAARPVAGVSDFLVDGRTGFALTSHRPAVVGREMHAALMDSRALRQIARRARRLVERRYAWEGTTAAFDSLYWNGGE